MAQSYIKRRLTPSILDLCNSANFPTTHCSLDWRIIGDCPFLTAERNAAIHRENVDRPLGDLRAEAARVHAELREALATLTEEELTDPSRFRYMPPDWVPLDIFAQNTYEHYEAHARGLEDWLSR